MCLVIEHENERCVGALLFDDPAFCSLMVKVLRGQLGRAIKDVGNMDLSQFL
jgi:hypothetical protein